MLSNGIQLFKRLVVIFQQKILKLFIYTYKNTCTHIKLKLYFAAKKM